MSNVYELARESRLAATDGKNARRMVGGKYMLKSLAALKSRDFSGARYYAVEAIKHWPDFAPGSAIIEHEIKISEVRATAGRAGAISRWGDGPRATACVRVYPADAAELRRLATESGRLPADVVADLLRG